jgi:hypothetical protein
MRESEILHQNGPAWVRADKKIGAYVVMLDGAVCAASDSAYALDADGLSIAIARCDYLASRVKCRACGVTLAAANAGAADCPKTNNYDHDFAGFPRYRKHAILRAVDKG